MVFSSVPAYLDPPNWNQQAQLQLGGGGGGGGGAEPHQYPPRSDGMMGTTAVRPASMADRARLAKVPQPEQALNCPRCDSTNTKFCYFNNYSLSQPRHFCKTCRRYWTRGGSLRNVPVGGGCRRNKRIKGSGSSSKSQASGATDGRQSGASSSSSTATTMANPAASHLPFMASLHPLADYTTNNYIGLNFSGLHSMDAGDYHVGGGSGGGLEQWRLQPIQQYPFLGGLEAPSSEPPLLHGLYPFDGEGVTRVDGSGRFSGQINPNPNSTILATSSQGLITQMASVKMEDSSQGLNLSRHYFGLPRNDQYWNGGGGSVGGGGSGGGWMMDLTGFNSTSSGNLL